MVRSDVAFARHGAQTRARGAYGRAWDERRRGLAPGAGRFHHGSLFYAGPEEFLAGTVPFIEGGLDHGEPVLVAVVARRERLLRSSLGARAGDVRFLDMQVLGRNPARIIPAWREFLDTSGAGEQPVRGISESIWPGRSDAEMCECERHESLLNVAFDGGPPRSLLCPYDLEGLDQAVIEAAQRTHPLLVCDGVSSPSERYVDPATAPDPFAGTLLPPGAPFQQLAFGAASLPFVRDVVERWARTGHLDPVRNGDLVLAVHELASNSVRHGGGRGILRIWREDGALLCEVHDAGHIRHPLAGRIWPRPEQPNGRGLWLVNHICDLVQIRSGGAGTVVRLRMETG